MVINIWSFRFWLSRVGTRTVTGIGSIEVIIDVIGIWLQVEVGRF